MSGNRLTYLEEKFQEGKLSAPEKEELEFLLRENPENELNMYFQWVNQTKQETDIVVSKGDFFSKLSTTKKSRYSSFIKYAAVLLIVLMAGYFAAPQLIQNNKEDITEAEIENAYQESLKTFLALSSYLNKGLQDMHQGLDFSAPFKDLKQLNTTTENLLKHENNK